MNIHSHCSSKKLFVYFPHQLWQVRNKAADWLIQTSTHGVVGGIAKAFHSDSTLELLTGTAQWFVSEQMASLSNAEKYLYIYTGFTCLDYLPMFTEVTTTHTDPVVKKPEKHRISFMLKIGGSPSSFSRHRWGIQGISAMVIWETSQLNIFWCSSTWVTTGIFRKTLTNSCRRWHFEILYLFAISMIMQI